MTNTMRYVALLRGINVAGQKSVKMEELRALLAGNGYAHTTTYIQSGNVAFDAPAMPVSERTLVAQIEQMLLSRFGFEVKVIVREQAYIRQIIDECPFQPEEIPDIKRLYVVLLSDVPDAGKLELLQSGLSEGEQYRLCERELYFTTTHYGNTKFTNAFIEKKLSLTATTRNWATMHKLMAL
ncbi:MAG: DUF1697 domain-containing protein [Chitinophagia bacterium]|nr:DUF1697 domain-containing protein [Chitinophagia bacterium]